MFLEILTKTALIAIMVLPCLMNWMLIGLNSYGFVQKFIYHLIDRKKKYFTIFMTFHFFLPWLMHLKQYTITYLKRITFRVYLFSRAKKNRFSRVLFFANDKFLKMLNL